MAKTISNIRVEYRARGAPKWDMRKAKQHLKSRQASAVKKRADYVRREAQKMSSFRTPSLSQLESLGHPYSKTIPFCDIPADAVSSASLSACNVS